IVGVGAAAVITGILALRKGQSPGMSWAGIITGGLGALISIIVVIIFGLAFDYIDDSRPDTQVTSSPTESPSRDTPSPTPTSPTSTPSPTPTESDSDTPTPTPSETEESTPEPTPETTSAAPTPEETEDAGSVSQQNALESAESYLSFTAFSRSGLIEQLEFEGYSNADATWAVDNVTVDWRS